MLSAHHYPSTALGIAFSVIQHRRFVATLESIDLPPTTSRVFALATSHLVAGLGAALTGYLIFAPH